MKYVEYIIINGSYHKGDVFATARIAGIQATKKTWDLIPLYHPLLLSKVEVLLEAQTSNNRIRIESYCRLSGKTGVEMEALTAASKAVQKDILIAALTIYDMCILNKLQDARQDRERGLLFVSSAG